MARANEKSEQTDEFMEKILTRFDRMQVSTDSQSEPVLESPRVVVTEGPETGDRGVKTRAIYKDQSLMHTITGGGAVKLQRCHLKDKLKTPPSCYRKLLRRG